MARALFALASLVVMTGCPSPPSPTPPRETAETVSVPGSSDGTVPDPPTDEVPAAKAPKAPVKTLFVAPALVDCEGEGPMKCLRVREGDSDEWTLLYQGIEGFAHEAGTTYELKVEVEEVSDPPADASSRRLRLVEIVSAKKAPEETAP